MLAHAEHSRLDLLVGEFEFGEEDGAVLSPSGVHYTDDLVPRAAQGARVRQVIQRAVQLRRHGSAESAGKTGAAEVKRER